jgi:membrane fusion protein, macrolide-specific efflux system
MEKDKIIRKSRLTVFSNIRKLLFGSKRKAIVTVIILIIIGGLLWWKFGQQQKKAQYQTTQVQKGNLISTVSESGNISSNQVNVTSSTDGVITEIYVKNGDHVDAGDKLFKVQATATPQEVASAYASYLSAVNALASAKNSQQGLDVSMYSSQQTYLTAQNNENYKNNNASGINPSTHNGYTDIEKFAIDRALDQATKDFASAQQKYKDATLAVNAAQAQLNSASLSYQATQNAVITAPISGTVANFSETEGSPVTAANGNSSSNTSSSSTSSSNTSSTGSTVLVLGDFTNLVVNVQASEVDVPKIHPGQKATITLDAFSTKTYVGEVKSVDLFGTNSSGVVTYNVYITFLAPPSDIQPGMTASAIIQTDRKDNVLYVPTSAIQTANDQSTVRILKNGQISSVLVETGIASDTDTEITSGLSEGDTVVTSIVSQTSSSSSTSTSPFSSLGGNRGFGGGGAAVRTSGR